MFIHERAILHFSIGRHKSSFPCLYRGFSVPTRERWKARVGGEKSQMSNIATNFRSAHKLLQFFEGKRAKHVRACVRVCVFVHAGTIAGFPFIPETGLRTLLRRYWLGSWRDVLETLVKYVSRNGETKGRKT